MGKLMTHLWFLASLLQNLHHGCNHTLHLVLPKSSMVLQHHRTLNSPKYPKSPCSVSKSRSATKDGARRTRWSQDFHHATDNRGPSFLPFLSLKTWLSGIPVNGPTILEIFSIKSYQINHLVYGVPNFDPYAPREVLFPPYMKLNTGDTFKSLLRTKKCLLTVNVVRTLHHPISGQHQFLSIFS